MNEKYTLSTDSMKNIVFDFVYKMALDDATKRIKGINQDIRKVLWNEKIKGKVKNFAEEVIEGEECDFQDCINNILKVVPKDFEKILTFGIIQKLLSMTMKYLYIKYYDTDKAKNFNCCNGPMDRVMRDSVWGYYDENGLGNTGFDRQTAWSKLAGSESIKKYKICNYGNFQNALDSIINKEKNNVMICNKIELDFRFWKPYGLEDDNKNDI